MNGTTRIRDLYAKYRQGQIPFERVVAAADDFLARYEASRAADQHTSESPERRER